MAASSSTFKPHRVQMRTPISKVKWDRKFRVVLLLALALTGWVGLRSTMTLLSSRGQAQRELQVVASLAARDRLLQAQERSLNSPATIMREARSLGMVMAGEQPYVVTGLPGH